jgi:two-component system NtrC family sensor kinase
MLEYTLQTSGVRVELEQESDVPEVLGDADQLHQVFSNLFVNAQHAMAEAPGPHVLRVTVRHLPESDRVVVQVSDSGPGIPESIRSRIFDPYFTTKPMGVGTGVGLSVCLSIVEAHAGSLRVDCPASGGTTFSVELRAAMPASYPPPPSSRHAPASHRVLVVDDEEEVRQTVREMLSLVDHDVVVSAGAAEALDLLAHRTFDAILCDVRMPDMDGVELHRQILTRWPALARRVVFMTGDALSATNARSLTDLHQPCIEKPFTPDDVYTAIDRVCEPNSKPRV